ncbi:type IV secretion system protein VirB10 [Xanthomonas albilineans]|uniref:Probable conjugal transfer protein n=1 Tax=Xanthomonas albilineans (strain GPE PC73 / CFBP 7063) TaxID=380358 RepID=D6CKB2_XANAP|nr:type IV secretion system protein VirB10 [Xanthomonas albilineans]CAZ15901.1 probable conjugal transfer protein [Xanthomonas albilineans]
MSDHTIDASGNIGAAEQERGAADLGDSRRRTVPGTKIFFLLVIIFGLLLCGFLIWQAMVIKHRQKDVGQNKPAASLATPMHPLSTDAADNESATSAPAPASAAAPITPQPTYNAASNSQPPAPSPAQLLRQRRLGSGLTSDSVTSGSASQPAQTPVAGQTQPTTYPYPPPSMAPGVQQQQANMQELLKPVRLEAQSARQVGSQNFLLLQGSMIPCVLVTHIDSGLPGMVSCDVTTDVYSANGHTVLLDRGTRITGLYQQGLQQGQQRLFVLWERAVTPQGVIINLDSPGTDQLGASGFGGKVDNHFFKRFGAAILLSVIEDAGQYAVASQESNNRQSFYFGNTSQAMTDMANTTLQHTINIPPTLLKRNGDLVSIHVARDLDFASIYSLKPRQ